MKRLLLMACSNTKIESHAGFIKQYGCNLMPAIERYDGPSYRVVRAYRNARHRLPKILILSALYGLIEPKHPITFYDHKLDERLTALFKSDHDGRRVVQNACYAAEDIFIFGGALYQEVFHAWLPVCAKNNPLMSITLPVTRSRGGIGEQLAQLKTWLNGEKVT